MINIEPDKIITIIFDKTDAGVHRVSIMTAGAPVRFYENDEQYQVYYDLLLGQAE